MQKTLIALCAGAALVASFASAETDEDGGPKLTIYENMDLFSDVFDLVRNRYVEEVDETELTQGALKGMLQSLDPHSTYFDSKTLKERMEQTSGEFGGLGIEVTMEDGVVKVVSPIDDTPAARAGVEAGDYIIAIDGETVLGLTLDDAVDKMRGPVGSDIEITISRDGADAPFDVTITRAIIKISAADVILVGDALVVRIATFSENVLANVAEGISEMSGEAGGIDKVSGFVLDLRNNPGGLLQAGVDISDAFLDRGEIVSVRGRGRPKHGPLPSSARRSR